MSDLRTDHTNREADTWAEFETALARVPLERWEEPGVVPDWTVKELVWHVAGWIDECSEHLEKIRAGSAQIEEDDDEDTDVRNAAFASQAREMTTDAVRAGLLASRELVRTRWSELPDVTDSAIEWFASETYQHYKEHLADLESFAAS
jgi:hypothetical protein